MLKLVAAFAVLSALAIASSEARVVCYFASWTIYRPGNGKFAAANVDPNLCTHILYAFVGLNEDGSVMVLDDWEATGLHEIENLQALKQQNGNLKIILSMGGWNEGSEKYSRVAADAGKRNTMVQSVLSYVNQWSMDGFDLDWEYPNQRGGNEADRQNFITLLGELKSALNGQGKMLTAAVAGGIASMDSSYDLRTVSDNLDMINVMTYDFHGAFETFVGHHAPLYASHLDQTDEQKSLNVHAGIQHWLDGGADASKINLGIGMYGRGFTLSDPSNTDLYAPSSGGCQAGPYSQQEGILGYNEICELHSDYQYVWDDEQKVPHRVQGNQWIGYEDTASVKIKVDHAKSLGLGGVMVWSLDTDDFTGICGGGKYPLLTQINQEWNS